MLILIMFCVAAGGTAIGVAVRHLVASRRGPLAAGGAVAVAGGLYASLLGLPLLASAVGLAAALMALSSYCRHYQRAFAARVKRARALANWLQARFDVLASGDTGMILITSLFEASGRLSFSTTDQEMLGCALKDFRYIGHVVDSYASTVGAAHGAGAVITVYGIDRNDLSTYPQRIDAEFQRQFGRQP